MLYLWDFARRSFATAGIAALFMTPACVSDPIAPAPEPPAAAPSVTSAFVTISVGAVVTGVTDPTGELDGAVAVGARVQGSCMYDESIPDSHRKADVGRYVFGAATSGLSFSVSELVFASDPGAVDMTIKLLNNKKTSILHDSFEARSVSNLDVLPGVAVATIELTFEDDTAAALSSDALTALPMDAGVWTSVSLVITGTDGWRIDASVVECTPTVGGIDAGRNNGMRKRLPGRPK